MARGARKKAARAQPASAAARAVSAPSSVPPPPPPTTPAAAKAPAWAHGVCAAVVASAFAPALPHPLQLSWDDARFLTENPLVMQPSWSALVAIFGAPRLEAYHPLHLLSYWLDAPWSGGDPTLLHATSLLLWIGASCALLRALVALGLGPRAALCAALSCAVHPIQVEVVSWATGRKDVLALLFASLAIAAHARSTRAWDGAAWGARGAYLLGVLSKTTVLPLPAFLFALDVIVQRKPWRRALLVQLPALSIGGGLAALVLAIWREHAMIRPLGAQVGNVLTRVVASVGHHVGTLAWPARVAPMYATAPLARPSWLSYAALLGLAVVFAALLAGARRGRRHAALGALSVLAFAVWLMPVCNAVPMVFPFQDRYASLPLAGVVIGLGAALDAWEQRAGRARSLVAGLLLVAALGARSAQYEGCWRSELALWGHAVSTQPDAYYAWMKLCEVRRRSGDLHGAVLACRKLVELEPARKTGYSALALSTALRDERIRHLAPSRAEAYAAALHSALDDAPALRALAARMLASGHLRTLEIPLARALALQPIEDAALERAAAAHFAGGRPSLGLFYLGQMRVPTRDPRLIQLRAAAEAALGNAPRIVD